MKKHTRDRSDELTLCKLEGGQVVRTRPLYEEVFSEDCEAFVEYYYENKAPGNTTFVLETDKREIVSMLHLTPYTLCIKTEGGWRNLPAYYVVAVATGEQYRHKGCMRRLLEAAQVHCEQQKVPYLYLMPADPAIYRPFGYDYCYARPEFYVNYKEDDLPGGICCVEVTGEKNNTVIEELTGFTNAWLCANCDFFALRTEKYYVNLLKELRAQKGNLYVFLHEGAVEGYYCRTGEGEPNMGCGRDCIQEAMLSEKLIAEFERYGRKPPILISEHRHEIIMGKRIMPVWKALFQEQENLISLQRAGWLTELV